MPWILTTTSGHQGRAIISLARSKIPREMPPISLTALGHEDHLDPLNISKKAALTKYIESHDYQHSIDHQL
jgi:hypothetical protein